MGVGLTLVGVLVFLVLMFVLVGGPMVLADWRRNRQEETIRRQIALTDAIDGQLGTLVAPRVRKPLWGPWEIELALPVSRTAVVGRILGIVHEVLSGVEGMQPNTYRVVLASRADSAQAADAHRGHRSVEPWTRHPVGVA
jgi:hypothetical protein